MSPHAMGHQWSCAEAGGGLTFDTVRQGAAVLAPVLPAKAELLPPHEQLQLPVVESKPQEVVHDVSAF